MLAYRQALQNMGAKMDKKKTLIIDDEKDFLRITAMQLKAKDYDTVAATDAVTAVSVAQEEKPDLILLDIGLPAGDGFTVMERLVCLERTVLTPVIVITGKDPSTFQEQALKAGAVAFIQKPIDIDELVAAIRNILGEPKESIAQNV
jgi:DNA-binding response OmpR family regulator